MNYQAILREALIGKRICEISDESGIGEATIRHWLTGPSVPSILNFCAVIEACGYTLTWKIEKNSTQSELEEISYDWK